MIRERFFRLVMRLYPRGFRETYGREMLELLRHRVERGEWGVLLRDLPAGALAERGEELRLILKAWRKMVLDLDLVTDLRHAVRRLAGSPRFTLLAVLVLAFGIGANTASFGVVNAFLLKPPPYTSAERLVDVYQDSEDGVPSSCSFPAYRDIAARTQLFEEALAAFARRASYESEDATHDVFVEYATASYLSVLGLRPFMGRWFQPEEDRPGAGATAVLSHHAWRSRFGEDVGVLGTVVRLNGAPVTIVGVGPERHGGLNAPMVADFWLSLSSLSDTFFPGAVDTLERRQDHWFLVKARLRDGIGIEDVRDGMKALAEEHARDYPETDEGRRITVFAAGEVRIHPSVDGSLYAAASGLMMMTGLVLLVACGNVANMLLVRGEARRKEIAVRVALGASRLRLLQQLLVESVSLSALGGLAGLLVATWLLDLAAMLRPAFPFPVTLELSPDLRVVAFALLLSTSTGVAFGLAPALKASRPDVTARLREDGPVIGVRRFSLRNLLVAVQIAVATVLLVTAGLLVRTFTVVRRAETGFAVDGASAVLTDVSKAGYSDAQSAEVFRQLTERAASIGGVEAVALTNPLPLTPGRGTRTLVIDDETPGGRTAEVAAHTVSPSYFETLRIPLRSGRGFDERDREGGRRVAIVSESMARAYWDGDALGRRFRFEAEPDSWVEVVGVVADVKVRSLTEPPTPLYYRPFAQAGGVRGFLLARSARGTGASTEHLRAVLRSINPNLPVLELTTLESRLDLALELPRLAAGLTTVLGALALVLSSVGLYAVVAFVVTRRTREVGIRMSMGAFGSDIARMVVAETAPLVVAGLGAGVALALVLTPALGDVLYGIEPYDPLTFLGVAAIIAVVALGASYPPSRRAARLDPVDALRHS